MHLQLSYPVAPGVYLGQTWHAGLDCSAEPQVGRIVTRICQLQLHQETAFAVAVAVAVAVAAVVAVAVAAAVAAVVVAAAVVAAAN